MSLCTPFLKHTCCDPQQQQEDGWMEGGGDSLGAETLEEKCGDGDVASSN